MTPLKEALQSIAAGIPGDDLTYQEKYAALRHIAADALYSARAVSHPEWCPVCKTYHHNPGVRTDAGGLVEQCPEIPKDDPRNVFANYPLTHGR